MSCSVWTPALDLTPFFCPWVFPGRGVSRLVAVGGGSVSFNAFLSAFFLSIHQTAPAESQALVSTECTIWPVSKPQELSVLRSSRSRGVEKMIGVGRVNSEAKSKSRLSGGRSGVETPPAPESELSESVEDIERRLVRAGVLSGCMGTLDQG